VRTAPAIRSDLIAAVEGSDGGAVVADLTNVNHLDDFGALLLSELRQRAESEGRPFSLERIPDKVEQILSLVHFGDETVCRPLPRKERTGAMIRLGRTALRHAFQTRYMVSFLGSSVLAMLTVIVRPRSLRWGDTLTQMEKVGVDAVPIVGLIGFLLGLVMAFTSALQLEQFGANIYVASLVALAMVSELGPIMTAIVVAGRSGSAFAAEIGSMRISEEIDALFIMGFHPTRFLAVPRMIASMIVVPLLTLFADLFAIAGGLVVGVFMLNLTPHSYIAQTLKTLTLFEVMWGLGKSVVFAAIVSWVGCLRGFQARGGADSVGNAATSAVVSAIFLIILFDSVFAVVRSYW
jgi:phospholipid/cholesterol/gamma-HCH transport system permease protein